MKKFWLVGLILLTFASVASRHSYIGHSWSKKLVEKCAQNTTVFFVSHDGRDYLGSGVLISREGRVLTAAHLVDAGASARITMILANGQEYDMRLLKSDARLDLAIVEPLASAWKFPFAKLQATDDLYVGQDVLVVGHPYGDYWTVTTGIISRLPWSLWYLCRVIETTALVNPGNSGGPMYNTNGEIVGIVSALKVSPFRQPIGIGIAVPIKQIRAFLASHAHKSVQIKRYRLGDMK